MATAQNSFTGVAGPRTAALLEETAAPTALTRPEFLKDRRQVFWLLQVGGWLLYGITKWINALALGKEASYIWPALCSVAIGFALTLGIRLVLQRVWRYGIGWILGSAMPLVALSAVIFSAVDTLFFSMLYEPDWNPKPQEYLGIAFIQSFLLTSWVGLYVGIRYYAQYREESLRVLKVTAMAHEAQLAMLRYQLNPHFLFNTLNAISTLILDNQSALASKMLDQLSAFLRYSLVNQPTDKVTLSQELDALALYLDIEKTRFEDRLQIILDVDDDTKDALVPSLILQPLIENAIKYAIAPSVDGGTITLKASRHTQHLEVTLQDTGPGLPNIDMPTSKDGSGVGLANTRERLKQIYSGNTHFEMHNRPEGGLEITMRLPFELRGAGQ